MIWNKLSKRFSLVAALFCAASTPVLAAEKPAETKAYTNASIASDGNDLAQPVQLFGSVWDGQPDHEYRLMAQFRLHTKKGDFGPVLREAGNPGGKVVDLGKLDSAAADLPQSGAPPAGSGTPAVRANVVRRSATFDVTRKDFTTLVNLPANATSIVRVEPQVYDATAKKYLTPAKTPAVLLMVDVRDGGQVSRVQSFSRWLPEHLMNVKTVDQTLALLPELDEWDLNDPDVAVAFERAIESDQLPPQLRAAVIKAMPMEVVKGKNNVQGILKSQSADGKPLIGEAATAKLKAMEK